MHFSQYRSHINIIDEKVTNLDGCGKTRKISKKSTNSPNLIKKKQNDIFSRKNRKLNYAFVSPEQGIFKKIKKNLKL